MRILVDTDDGSPECKFAVRSGGHTVWPGAAGAQDGVTIDMSMMNSTVYHAENSTATIMAGARWKSVYKTLKEDGVAVTGGRSDTVGMGLILGGRAITGSRHAIQRLNIGYRWFIILRGTRRFRLR